MTFQSGKSFLLRSTTLATAAVGATTILASPAHAIEVTNLTHTSATNVSSSQCTIGVSYDLAKTQTDQSPGQDLYRVVISDSAGTPSTRLLDSLRATTVETPSPLSFNFQINVPSSVAYHPHLIIEDVITGSPSVIVNNIPLSNPILMAAGGACARLVSPNQAPTADAGSDNSVVGGDNIVLDGTAFDANGDNLSVNWAQTAGPIVALTNPNSLSPAFVAPGPQAGPQQLTFQLEVNDGVLSATDLVNITVQANQAPTAAAGPDQTVSTGQTVLLDGSASTDPENQALTYQWVQATGPSVSLTGANTATATFVAPPVAGSAQILEFDLVVDDGIVSSVADRVVFTVLPNQAPAVDAGTDQNISGGSSVTLAGSASDQDNDPLTIQWVQTAGTAVTLSDPNALNPTFTAPARARDDELLLFELRADDGTVISSDSVDITVAGNQAPNVVAVVNPTSGLGNSQFTLDGSGTTDPEGDQIIYIWSQVSGPTGTIADPSAAVTTFTAPQGGLGTNQTMTFQLTAVDTFDESNSETASATLLANRGPVADAGADQSVGGSSLVTLDGSASNDPDNDPLTYTWSQTGGATVTLSDVNAVQPTFTAPAATGQAQVLEFELLVEDRASGGGTATDAQTGKAGAKTGLLQPPTSSTDTVVITILANRPPVANAGPDQGPVDAGQTVTLDGSGSTDPDNDALTYSWVQTSGDPVTLDDPNAAQPTFTAPNVNGVVTFELTVSDGSFFARDTVSVELRAVGSITIVQQIIGSDTQVAFTSSLAALATTLNTNNGTAQVSAQNVPTGTYTVTAADLTGQGIGITDITCSDSNSVGDVTTRTATIDLSAGEDVTCTFSSANSREAAQAAIYNFLTGRNQLILSHQPDLQRRLDRLSGRSMGQQSGSVSANGIPIPGSEKLPVQASMKDGQARFATSMGMAMGGSSERVLDIWAEGYFSRASIGSQKADFRILYLGADVKLADSILVGGILQLDDYSDRGEFEVGEAEGDGWMVGPYVTARLAPQLYIEARAAWGSSDNRVSPLADIVDAFDTDRSLYSGSLFGELEVGEHSVLRPELTVRHFSEKQKAYTDSLGITVPAQTVDQGDISFKPRLSHLVELESGWSLRPFGVVEGIYTFGTKPDQALANILPNGFAETFGGVRARIEGGLDIFSKDGIRASVSGFHDGIGASEFSNTGVHFGLSFGF